MFFALCFALTAMFPFDGNTSVPLEDVYQPSSLDVNSRDQLLIVDEGSACVQVYDASGQHVATIGRKGQGPGEFQNPVDAAILSDDRVVVSDSISGNIQLFDAEFQFVKRIPIQQVVGRIHTMSGDRILLTRDPGRNIYLKIGTEIQHRYAVFDLDGKQLSSFGEWIPHDSLFFAMMLNSGATAVQGENLVYVGLMTNDLIYFRDGAVEKMRYPITFEPVEPKSSQKKFENDDGTFDIQMKVEADTLSAALAILPSGELMLMRATQSVPAGDDVPFERVRLASDGRLLERYPGSYFAPRLALSANGKQLYLLHETDDAVVLETWPL